MERWRGAMRIARFLAFNRRGAAAIEFAVVGLVFITMTMFVMDLGLQLYTQSVMDDAARTAAHNIKTGNRASASNIPIGTTRPTAADVRTTVCNLLSLVATPCTTTTLQVYATHSNTFAALSRVDSPTTGLGINNGFDVGGSNAYVLLQVAFRRMSVIPFSGLAEPYLVSTIMFENEL